MIISGSLRHLDVKGCDIAAEVIKLLNTLSSSLTVVVSHMMRQLASQRLCFMRGLIQNN